MQFDFSAKAQSSRQSTLTVLVVEDNPTNQLLVRRYLQKLGLGVCEATTVAAAHQALETQHVDLILMDCGLPDGDGPSLTAQLRTQEAFATIPIVALTGYTDTDTINTCLRSGMNGYLTKPIDFDSFSATLKQWLGERMPQPSMQQSLSSQNDTPELSLIDFDALWERMDGDEAFLADALTLFQEELGRLHLALETALIAEAWVASKSLCHELKGMCLNMSANQVANEAKTLEQALCDPLSADAHQNQITALWKTLSSSMQALQNLITWMEDSDRASKLKSLMHQYPNS